MWNRDNNRKKQSKSNKTLILGSMYSIRWKGNHDKRQRRRRKTKQKKEEKSKKGNPRQKGSRKGSRIDIILSSSSSSASTEMSNGWMNERKKQELCSHRFLIFHLFSNMRRNERIMTAKGGTYYSIIDYTTSSCVYNLEKRSCNVRRWWKCHIEGR